MLYVGPGISAREAHQAKQKERASQRELFGERVDEHAAAPTLVHAGADEPVGRQRYGSTLAWDSAPADRVVPAVVPAVAVPPAPLVTAAPLLAQLEAEDAAAESRECGWAVARAAGGRDDQRAAVAGGGRPPCELEVNV